MTEVALEEAVLVAVPCDHAAGRPIVSVYRFGDDRIGDYEYAFGACEARWIDNANHRLGLLHRYMWFLVSSLRIDPATIERAVGVIPEYRDMP